MQNLFFLNWYCKQPGDKVTALGQQHWPNVTFSLWAWSHALHLTLLWPQSKSRRTVVNWLRGWCTCTAHQSFCGIFFINSLSVLISYLNPFSRAYLISCKWEADWEYRFPSSSPTFSLGCDASAFGWTCCRIFTPGICLPLLIPHQTRLYFSCF